MKGFREFVLRGNVIELAVAVIIGAAFTAIVQSFVKDLLTPLLGAFGGTPDFSGVYFEINRSRFMIGNFINNVISFLIIAAVVYFLVVVPYTRMMERLKPSPAPVAKTRTCPECASKIPVEAKRCAFCTAVVTPMATGPSA